MKRVLCGFFLSLICGTFVANAHVPSEAQQKFNEWYHEQFSDSGIQGPKYADLVSDFKRLETLFPGMVKVIRIDSGLPLPTIVVRIQSEDAARKITALKPAVVITGSTHGNEYLHIEDRLPAWFLEHRLDDSSLKSYFEAGGVIYLVPIYNPWGYENRRRENQRGTDLNRDYPLAPEKYPGLRETETKDWLNYLNADLKNSNLKFLLSMDYHCCAGAILYPWSYTMDPIPAIQLEKHKKFGEFTKQLFGYRHGICMDVLGYAPVGTSKDHYHSQFANYGFVFEGNYGNEDRNFPRHTEMWHYILGSIKRIGTQWDIDWNAQTFN